MFYNTQILYHICPRYGMPGGLGYNPQTLSKTLWGIISLLWVLIILGELLIFDSHVQKKKKKKNHLCFKANPYTTVTQL